MVHWLISEIGPYLFADHIVVLIQIVDQVLKMADVKRGINDCNHE